MTEFISQHASVIALWLAVAVGLAGITNAPRDQRDDESP